MFLKRNYCYAIFLTLFLSFQLFYATNEQNNQKQSTEKIILPKKGIQITKKRLIIAGASLALLYWLTKQEYVKPDFWSLKKPRTIKNQFQDNEEEEKRKIEKYKENYNKERQEMVNDLLMYLEYAFTTQTLRTILRVKTQNLIDLACQQVAASNFYHQNSKINNLTDIEKIKLCCLFNYFANQSNQYCEKIATITQNTFSENFDFHTHKSEWQIPTQDEIFAYIKNYIFVGKNGKIRFGMPDNWNFEINDIDSISNFFVGSLMDKDKTKSINEIMTAIFLALSQRNADFLKDALIPQLKELLQQGYDLNDAQRFDWFCRFIFNVGEHDENSFKSILSVLNCFYPTEFLLSKECLTAKQMTIFCRINYKMWGSLNNGFNIQPIFDDREEDIRILYHIVSCAEKTNGDNSLFDLIFTEENLHQEWLQKLLGKEGIAQADVIWNLLKQKDEETRNQILSAINSEDLKNTLGLFQQYEIENTSLFLSVDSDEINYNLMNDEFFTSHNRFSQLFYNLMRKKDNFSNYMGQIFESNMLKVTENLFLEFIKNKFVLEEENVVNHVYQNKNTPIFLRETTPGMMISNQDYVKQKNFQNQEFISFINKYSATRDNTLLVMGWYKIHCKIDLYQNTHQDQMEFYNNKEYLAQTFKENLSAYKLNFNYLNLNDDLKNIVSFENSDTINIASTYHLLSYVQENSLYDLQKKGVFIEANKEWIEKNDMCKFLVNNLL